MSDEEMCRFLYGDESISIASGPMPSAEEWRELQRELFGDEWQEWQHDLFGGGGNFPRPEQQDAKTLKFPKRSPVADDEGDDGPVG